MNIEKSGGPVFRHRSATAAVALAASAALIPGTAFAAGSAPAGSKAIPGVINAPASTAKPVLKSFSSPASKAIPFRDAASAGARITGKATSSTPTVDIYVAPYTTATCSNAAGAGTEADPYCSIQDAVNAAVPGDTIGILSGQGYFSTESVTVAKSGLSIVGIGTGTMDWGQTGTPALTLDGASDITISNLNLHGPGQDVPAVEVLGSSNVTFDSDYIEGGYAGTNPVGTAVEIDGSSSHVTVSRTYLDTNLSAPVDPGVVVESGASAITFAGDILASAGISATGVSGLQVAGNTIQRGCDAAVDVKGASTGVSVEDNVIEDANPDTDYYLGGFQSQCQTNNQGWAPDVNVSADSAAGTTTDYNDFYVYGTDGTAEYDWAGTSYTSLADFQAAVGQGVHDTLDPVESGDKSLGDVDTNLATGSLAIGSANASAPGELPTDFYGDSPYTSRGAVQYNTHNQTLGLTLSAQDTSAKAVSLGAYITSAAGFDLMADISWGDGRSDRLIDVSNSSFPFGHAYAKAGSYTITVVLTDGKGDGITNSVDVTLAGTTYTKFGPTRLLDTRKGIGTGGVIAPIPANGGTIKLEIAGNSGIAADAWAVAANITVTGAKAQGYITAYPDGTTPAALSSVNFTADQNVANTAVVSVGDDGSIVLANHSAGTVDVIVDVSGYFTPTPDGSGYTSITPVRFLDTRNGTGGYAYKTISQGHPATLKIEGKSGIPSSGVTAVAVNITEANATGNGLITAWPGGTAQPATSNLNFAKGEVRAASAIVPVGSDGTIHLAYGGSGATRLIVDVEGYFSSTGSNYVPVFPYRAFDTRKIKDGTLPGGWFYELPVGSYGDLGPDTITGMVSNTTVTGVTAVNGDLVIFPNENASSNDPVTVPNTSALNFVKGQTVANMSFVTPGWGGDEDYYNQSSGNLQLIIDVMGYFMAG